MKRVIVAALTAMIGGACTGEQTTPLAPSDTGGVPGRTDAMPAGGPRAGADTATGTQGVSWNDDEPRWELTDIQGGYVRMAEWRVAPC